MSTVINLLDSQFPALPIYFDMSCRIVRKGVDAFDDAAAVKASPPYGGVSRDAYLWDLPTAETT